MKYMRCANEQPGETGIMCKATGYRCRYVSSNPRKHGCPCLFDPIFEKCKQVQRMLESIRTVRVGSEVTAVFKTKYGHYTREVIDSSRGKVLKIDQYGRMEIQLNKLKFPLCYGPENFTMNLYLSHKELEEKLDQMQDELEEQERVKSERREEDMRMETEG